MNHLNGISLNGVNKIGVRDKLKVGKHLSKYDKEEGRNEGGGKGRA